MHPATKVIGPDPQFLVRGTGVTRVEAICDAMFGFAVTLLVVGSFAANSYEELIHVLRAFPAFAFSFAILARIWYSHYLYHRRYGLEDRPTIVMNLALMFVVLFFVFPLKILIGYTTEFMIWVLTHRSLVVDSPISGLKRSELAFLLEIFAAGFALVNLLFSLMYVHAYRLREPLELNPSEAVLTRNLIEENAIVGLLFTGTALVLEWKGIEGMLTALGLQIVAAVARKVIRRRSRKAGPPTSG